MTYAASRSAQSENVSHPKSAKTAALDYVRRGWPVIRLEVGTKRPSGGKEWQKKAVTTPEAVQTIFNGDGRHNVGVLLGNRLCDVDLDCAEAIDVAGYFLPETRFAFGRATKRMAHRVYNSDAADTIRKATQEWEDPEAPGKPLLELRVGGGGKAAQTVFPGSVHEGGESIEFEPGFAGDPAEVSGSELIRACEEVAAACLVARAWPREGGHRPAQVLGGFLARAGWDESRVELFTRAVMAHVRGPHVSEHARTARNAAEAHGAGGNTFGFPALSEVFGAKRAKAIAKWLGYQEAKSSSSDSKASTGAAGAQADTLMQAATEAGIALYHAVDGAAYADIPVADHVETWAVRSSSFKRWLRRLYYERTGKAPNSETLESALGALDARAQFDAGTKPVYLRVAEHGGKIYIDLCDAAWRVVEVSSAGWRIAADAPVRFRRSRGMLPLPTPAKGGKVSDLHCHLNMGEDAFLYRRA